MAAVPFGVVWGGYLLTIWGFTLIRGWNIRLRDLANPLHPYQWPEPPKQPPTVPKGRIFPGGPQAVADADASRKTPGRTGPDRFAR